MDEIIEEFLVESYENLDRLDIELVELEEHPDSAELIGSIFRNVHTIKGTAGFFEFPKLESVAHAAESLLSRLRDRELQLSTAITSALLSSVDAIRSMLGIIQETGSDGDDPYDSLVAELHALIAGEAVEEVIEVEIDAEFEAEFEAEPVDPEVAAELDAYFADAEAEHTDPESATETGEHAMASSDTPSIPEPEPAPVVETTEAASNQAGLADASIRVDVGLLDRLMNLVGELVLARNQVLQHQSTFDDSAFQSTSQQLDLITTELQEGVMKTRMQPIGNVWQKLPRVVRDLATNCDKKVRLLMEGEETELDKTLIEAIKDPLTHIVRNSVDHGLESPEVRVAAGKPEVGLLKLRALHEGGQVIIEISDDGAGLNYGRIKEKAISSGIITADRAAQLSDRETANLIFRPGFSTAAAITNVSGRGVGMDVVKTNVEKIGGSLEISSVQGLGTTLTIKIPLTLAIIPALIITSDGDRYLIPQINLVEVLRVDGASTDSKLEMAGDAPVLRLRGNLLPIVHLRSLLELPEPEENLGEGVSIAVLDADGVQFGLVVDHINDTEEIVVKPLSPHLKNIGCFAGTTIMGDGAVSLILDTIGLARMGGVLIGQEQRRDADEGVDEFDRRSKTHMVLVCNVVDQRVGIPLSHVSRLEELASNTIERAAGHDVIQYRDQLLRLIYVTEALGAGRRPAELPEVLQVLVHESPAGIHGLVVDQIVDVFEIDADTNTGRDGMRISGVIGRRVTDLINVDRMIEQAIGASGSLELAGSANS